MENISTWFPHVGENIFKNLNNKDLVRCRGANKAWRDFIDNNRLIWTRKIQIHINDFIRHQNDWKLVLNKASFQVLKELAMDLNENDFDVEYNIRYYEQKENRERMAIRGKRS